MASFNSQLGDIGLEIIAHFTTCDCDGLIIDLDLSTQTTLEICLKKPDTTVVVKTAVFTPVPCGLGDGTDGKASYVTLAGDLDQAGTWCISGHVIFADGREFRSNAVTFEVETPICP